MKRLRFYVRERRRFGLHSTKLFLHVSLVLKHAHCFFLHKTHADSQNDIFLIESYLAPEVPLWIHAVVYGFRSKLLSPDCDDRVRIWFTFPQHADVLLH